MSILTDHLYSPTKNQHREDTKNKLKTKPFNNLFDYQLGLQLVLHTFIANV